MSKGNKNRFRTGQRVQLAADPGHVFVIDRSLVPERIYHEKGSNRWWTRNELQRLGSAENPATSLRLNGKGNACGMRAKCMQDDPAAAVPASGAPFLAPETTQCLECGAPFKPTREWQKFDRTTCRYAYWRRVKSTRAERAHCGLSVGFDRQMVAERLN